MSYEQSSPWRRVHFGCGQNGPVWFLAGSLTGSLTGGPANRNATIPAGTALFFPIMNTSVDDTDCNGREGSHTIQFYDANGDPTTSSEDMTYHSGTVAPLPVARRPPAGFFGAPTGKDTLWRARMSGFEAAEFVFHKFAPKRRRRSSLGPREGRFRSTVVAAGLNPANPLRRRGTVLGRKF